MKRLIATSLLALSLTAAGCATRVAFVAPLPPRARVEVIGVAPYRGAVWVPGHWVYSRYRGEWFWVRGYWH